MLSVNAAFTKMLVSTKNEKSNKQNEIMIIAASIFFFIILFFRFVGERIFKF